MEKDDIFLARESVSLRLGCLRTFHNEWQKNFAAQYRSRCMSEDQRDAMIGRLLRERREVQNHLTKLKADANRMSQRLRQLAEMLERSPQDVWFYGRLANIKIYAPRSTSFDIADFDMQPILDLTDEIRATREKLNALNSEASKHGF
jgi:hypothetical protein